MKDDEKCMPIIRRNLGQTKFYLQRWISPKHINEQYGNGHVRLKIHKKKKDAFALFPMINITAIQLQYKR